MDKRTSYGRVNHYIGSVLFLLVLVVAIGMRVWQLGTLPPGVGLHEAQWALSSMLVSQGASIGGVFNGTNAGFAAHVLSGAAVACLEASILTLRYLSALWGVLAVVGLYVWVKDAFGRRPALLTSFFMAVSPWSVTLSRSFVPVNLAIFALVWLCVCVQRAYKTGHWAYWIGSVFFMVLGCFSARLFWLVPVVFALSLPVLFLQKKLAKGKVLVLVGVALSSLFVIVPLLAITVLGSGNPTSGLLGRSTSVASVVVNFVSNGLENTGKTFLMFFWRGDENYTNNLAGMPMLNTFAALMFLLGIMLAITRRSPAIYVFLLIALGVLLLPGIVSPSIAAPDAYRTALAIPIVFVLVGIGTNYLLTRWYGMFPINSTARSLGLSLVILIMLLSAYQAYRQYFVAWAQDPQTFVAYREDLLVAARSLDDDANKVFVIAGKSEQAALIVARGLPLDRKVGGSIEELEQLPLNAKPSKVIIPADALAPQTELKRRLEAKYPGGSYQSTKSPFNERQILVWYKTK